ncbi:MAG: tRNA adenosine(34) deaminase TadA [Xanthomonadales bacterium]|jgi:tRNA(adenine34) deaminase|nr:tRNA adenosine(34) deaminase TadA [Xanthomonadales bacterium]
MTDGKTFSDADRRWMERALDLARRAEAEGEVPVGAVVVNETGLLGEGWNRNIGLSDPTAHAEIIALREAGHRLNNYRLPRCTLYVTLEPCAMCVGAAIHARLERLVFGAVDPKTGALGGAYSLPAAHRHNHELAFAGGLLEQEAAALLRDFFRRKRQGSG